MSVKLVILTKLTRRHFDTTPPSCLTRQAVPSTAADLN